MRRNASFPRRIEISSELFQAKKAPRITRAIEKMIFLEIKASLGRRANLDLKRKIRRSMEVARSIRIRIRRGRSQSRRVVKSLIAQSLVRATGRVAERRKSRKIRKVKERIKIKVVKKRKVNQKVRKILKNKLIRTNQMIYLIFLELITHQTRNNQMQMFLRQIACSVLYHKHQLLKTQHLYNR